MINRLQKSAGSVDEHRSQFWIANEGSSCGTYLLFHTLGTCVVVVSSPVLSLVSSVRPRVWSWWKVQNVWSFGTWEVWTGFCGIRASSNEKFVEMGEVQLRSKVKRVEKKRREGTKSTEVGGCMHGAWMHNRSRECSVGDFTTWVTILCSSPPFVYILFA